MGNRLEFKNTWGSQATAFGGGLDAQRVDLFKVTLFLPQALIDLGLNWQDNVQFAIEKFPFPDRTRELIAVKYMQQTNQLIGADTAGGPVEVTVRYAFQERTAQTLEAWFQLVANQRTGGVGLTSMVKSRGILRWLVPNMDKQIADLRGAPLPGEGTMTDGLTYELEGCLIRGLKYTDPDMTQSANVNMMFGLSIDRVIPPPLDRMTFPFA